MTNFEAEAAELKQKLANLESERIRALEAEHQEKLNLVNNLEIEAAGFRDQAAKAPDDTEKSKLYKFAIDADKKANALRLELGLQPVELVEPAIDESQIKKLRLVNSLLIKSAVALLAYLIADFSSSKLDAGFFSFGLKSFALILYPIAALFGGFWLAISTLLRLMPGYSFVELQDDFKESPAHVRLLILAGLVGLIIYFFSNAFNNAI